MFHTLSTFSKWPNFIWAFQSSCITFCRVCMRARFSLLRYQPYRWLNTNAMWPTFNRPFKGCRSWSVSSCVCTCSQLLLILCLPCWQCNQVPLHQYSQCWRCIWIHVGRSLFSKHLKNDPSDVSKELQMDPQTWKFPCERTPS